MDRFSLAIASCILHMSPQNASRSDEVRRIIERQLHFFDAAAYLAILMDERNVLFANLTKLDLRTLDVIVECCLSLIDGVRFR